MTDLRRLDPLHLTPGQRLEAERLYVKSLEFERAGTPANTRRAYEGDWRRFSEWSERWGHRALPAPIQSVILYITYLADPERPSARRASKSGACKPATIDRAIAAISHWHKARGYVSPRQSVHVQQHLRKVKNTLACAPEQAPPLLVRHLERIVSRMPATDPVALRDKALILTGWAGALRRSELAALDRKDVVFTSEGVVLTIGRSKTDQESRGAQIPIEPASNPDLCPVAALRVWLETPYDLFTSELTDPLFPRTYFRVLKRERIEDREVSEVIKTWTRKADVVPDQPGIEWSGHSLRAGFITEAARAGRPEWQIMGHSRHKSYEAFRTYIRKANLFQDNPGRGLL